MKIDGVECKRVSRMAKKENELYAVIPLEALHKLGGNSDKAGMLVLLYCYGRMGKGGWFILSGRALKRYGITPQQKRKLLASFEESGLLKLRKQPGKSTEIRLTLGR